MQKFPKPELLSSDVCEICLASATEAKHILLTIKLEEVIFR